MLSTRPLADWHAEATAGPAPRNIAAQRIPATVPGVIHLDLLRNELIPDPYLDDNESLLAWIGLVDWTYDTTFDVTEAEFAASQRHELVFLGIDTVATITLNDQLVGQVANQHRNFRFDVTGALRIGTNELTVAFRSPVRYADEQSLALGARPRPYPMPFEAIRKSACSFGWDWGIATYSSGLWRPVNLESWSGARLEQVLVRAEVDGSGGRVEADVTIDTTAEADYTMELEVGGVHATVVVPAGQRRASVSVALDSVERWWPAGYGTQRLYDVAVRLGTGGSDVLDEVTRRVGFRSVSWITAPDSHGSPFQLVVNDQPIFVKGANWIPDDAFPSRVDASRYRRRLEQARSANLNLIRVWGGGIYEDGAFFELCDELGLLTWQDFLFACAAYPEEEPLRSEIEAEARDNVARIAHHASLVLLSGNNENLWGYEDWGWKERLDGRTWGSYYYYDLFPAIVAELAPSVAYAPGSPFSPNGEHPNAEHFGTMHIWDLWNEKDWKHYRDYVPRFVAEFGWQGPPNYTTMRRSISDEPLTPESPGMIVHQKATEGNVKLNRSLVKHFRVPDDLDSWHWATQLNQANALSLALEHFRSHAPETSGAVIWQLNDCWPVTSWSAIDGDGREKPVFFAIQNAFAPRHVSIQPRDAGLVVHLTNDTAAEWSTRLDVSLRGFDGGTLREHSVDVLVPARGSAEFPISQDIADADAPASQLIVAEAAGKRGLWFFAEPRSSALVAPRLSATVAAAGDGFDVTVTSLDLVRDLTLISDRVDAAAVVDRGLITLLPGESATFRVTGIHQLDAHTVLQPTVLRSANQLVALS
jgi:beta-mannosidase